MPEQHDADWTPGRTPGWTADDLPLIGEPFAVELANSDYEEYDTDFLADELIDVWFAHAPCPGDRPGDRPGDLPRARQITPATAASVRAVRDATRVLLGQLAAGQPLGEGSDAIATLNAAARRAAAHSVLELDDQAGPTWALHHTGHDPDVLVAEVATRCILFLGGEDAARVRRCARPQCPMFFVQHHRARRFCHESCAHRVRQSRYYHRTRAR